MGIIIWIIFGAFVGWIASRIMKSETQHSVLFNVAIGAIGAVIGGWLMSLIGQKGVGYINLYSFLVALTGAIVLIWIIKSLQYFVSKIKKII